jgi:hypothetical protein
LSFPTASPSVAGTVIAMDGVGTPVIGSLGDVSAAAVIVQLATERRTGILKIGESAPAWLALSEGHVVLAGSSASTPLRDALRSAGLVDEATLLTLERRGFHDLQLISELAAQVDPAALVPLVRERCISTLFEMLLPSDEQYAFLPGDPLGLAVHFSFPTLELLDLAQQRVEDWARIAAAIPSTQIAFRCRRRLAAEITEVRLDLDQWAVVAVLDGRRTVSQVIAALGRPAYDVCSILHQLLQEGLIERAG